MSDEVEPHHFDTFLAQLLGDYGGRSSLLTIWTYNQEPDS